MEPDGPTTIKPWMVLVGVAVLVTGYYVYKKHQGSSNSGSTLNTGAYGPPAMGTGVLQPIVIQSPGGSSAPVSTVQNTSGGSSPVPAGSPAQQPSQYQNGFYSLSKAAAQSLLNSGQTLYQSGADALGWAAANGQPTSGINPNSFYALSPTAALSMINSGTPIYQSGQEALAGGSTGVVPGTPATTTG